MATTKRIELFQNLDKSEKKRVFCANLQIVEGKRITTVMNFYGATKEEVVVEANRWYNEELDRQRRLLDKNAATSARFAAQREGN
jgi:hypothetical protein